MGCLGMGVDPKIAKILAKLDIKVNKYQKVFEEEAKKAKLNQEKHQGERRAKLEQLKQQNQQITEDIIRDLNKQELKDEIELLTNQVNKMHYIFTLGLELVEPIRKVTLDKLLEKAKTAPYKVLNSINRQIDEIKSYPILEFLNSTYGKVLREALETKGMSSTILNGYKNKWFKERHQRRKAEKEEFGIEKNEFDEENIDNIKLELYDLVETEIFGDKEDGKQPPKETGLEKNYKEYVRGKMVEAWFGK